MFGIALVTLVVVMLLSLVSGIRQSLELAADPRVWIVLSRGINSEAESYLPREQFDILRTRPEIATNDGADSLISGELVVPFNAAIKRPANQFYPATLRGVNAVARLVHPKLKVIEGHWPSPGRQEMAIGRKLLQKFPELGIGTTFRYGHRNWTIVGVIADAGSVRESEFWTDLDVLEQDAHFQNGFSSLHVVLKPGMEESFERALTADARITADLFNERDYYAEQALVADRLRILVVVVSAIIGLGAAFGGMNTMYAAVLRRARELGVLRALGFGRGSVILSILVESELLALAGGLLGIVAALALMFVTGFDQHMLSIGALTFSSRFSLSACTGGIFSAFLVGAAGGLLPAARAAHMSVSESLRL